MANANQQDLINAIMTAVYVGNGRAAEEAAQKINEEFILIRKSDLPKVEPKPQSWGNLDVPMARTAGYRGRSPEMYWNRALDFISVALHAEAEVVKEGERVLDWQRKEAYKMLYPYANIKWDYSTLDLHVKKKVDVVVNLMTQVDELKKAK